MALRAGADLGAAAGSKATAVPFGINMDVLPDDCPSKQSLNKLNLLFVSTDWERKGGKITLAALDHLHRLGIAATLTFVGGLPPRHATHPGVVSAGYLDKNKPCDAAHLTQLYKDAHLLILPTRADCTPMVVAEAMAHGTPALATETGGMATLLGQRGPGQLMAMRADGLAWAHTIHRITSNPVAYAARSRACFAHVHSHLTWTVWAGGVHSLLQDAVWRQNAPATNSAA